MQLLANINNNLLLLAVRETADNRVVRGVEPFDAYSFR